MKFSFSFLHRKIPVLLPVILVPFVFAFFYFLFRNPAPETPIAIESKPCPETMMQIRSRKYTFTNPLYLTDLPPSQALSPMRDELIAFLNQQKEQNKITKFSIYFRKMDGGLWFGINPNETFKVGILSRLSAMLMLLKRQSLDNHYLEKRISVTEGALKGSFSYEDLLNKMVVNGNADAEKAILKNMDASDFTDLYADLKINPKSETIEDISKVMRVIYNGTYFRNNDISEMALKLLSTNSEKSALQNGISVPVKMAKLIGNSYADEYSEIAIVYYNDNPYMLGVQLTGQSKEELVAVLTEVSKRCLSGYKSNILD